MDFGLEAAPEVLSLPPAKQRGVKPLFEALKDRRSTRGQRSGAALSVSNLL
jgi:hypothetical protein